jgi:MFS family permease
LSASDLVRTTYRLELWRSAASGILETAGNTFLLLIAVRFYQAGATAKALIAAGSSVGYLATPLVVGAVARLGWPAPLAAARLFTAGAVVCALMIALPFLPVYVAGSVLAMTAWSAVVPLLTQVHQDNYPENQRGLLYARTFMARIVTSTLFAWAAGSFLTHHLAQFRVVLLGFAAAFLVGRVALSRIPAQPPQIDGRRHPLHALRFLRQDRLFRRTLTAWMFMGFANLMMLPLRVEYLANPRYGLSKTAAEVALLTLVIPNLARLCMTPLWGYLFDRMNFFGLRVAINVAFAVGIVSFFTSDSTLGLVLAALVYGIAGAGGDVAWGLWVTKFAPPERVADYMSVHTFFTGVRGVLAPYVAFQAARILSLPHLGFAALGLIALSAALLIPEIDWHGQKRARI